MTCLLTVGYYAVIVYICTKVKLTYFTELSLSELVDLLLVLIHLFGIGGAAGGDGGCHTTGEGCSTTASGALVCIPLPPLVTSWGLHFVQLEALLMQLVLVHLHEHQQ